MALKQDVKGKNIVSICIMITFTGKAVKFELSLLWGCLIF